ncbi:class I SAM-dependent methyltransferase [Streptacidiphilus monticola]
MTSSGYDAGTAAAYREAREIPGRDCLPGGRRSRRRRDSPRDDGAGRGRRDGAFATAFHDWFGVRVVAVEPAVAMRELIPAHPAVEVREGRAEALPVADASADAAWLGSVVHHLDDLAAAARELRRALRPGALC